MIFYSICNRFMTKDYPTYLEWRTDCKCEEIVSVDGTLLNHDVLCEYDNQRTLTENQQWVAVLVIKEGVTVPTLEGFEFCGYDLVEDLGYEFSTGFGTSSLTNCSFDEVFSFKDLNQYGLLDSRKKAERIQELLPKMFPYEHHAYCLICAVWRKINNDK